jgi:hypothetical protein
MRISFLLSLAAPLVLAAGCNSKKPEADAPAPPPPLSQVLPTLPFPPDAQPVTTQSGADATQVILVTPQSPDSVAAYYRRVLGEPPFRLVNETTSNGVISFLADQNGPSLWVTIQPNGTSGSQVTLAGGAVDSTRKKSAADPTKGKSGGS